MIAKRNMFLKYLKTYLIRSFQKVLSVILFAINFLVLVTVHPLNHFASSVYLISNDDELRKRVSGKIVLVTGSSSGIGESVAKKYAELGAIVIISGRSKEKLDIITNNIKYSNDIISWVVDLDDTDSISSKYDELKTLLKSKGLHGIDILINNAGISSRGGALETELKVYRKLMSTNFFGTIELTKLIVSDMINNKIEGSIGVISSVQGKVGLPYRTAYAASKHALQAYFDGLRAELSKYKITVSIISPGYVNTNLSLNAINSDGTSFGKTDSNTLNGMKPEYLADKVIIAVTKKIKDIVIADFSATSAILTKVLLPDVLAKILEKRKR